MDRRAKTGVITDLLAKGYLVTLFDQRFTGCTNMLRHGDYNHFRCGEGMVSHLAGEGFHIVGVDTTKEGKGHPESPLAENSRSFCTIHIIHQLRTIVHGQITYEKR